MFKTYKRYTGTRYLKVFNVEKIISKCFLCVQVLSLSLGSGFGSKWTNSYSQIRVRSKLYWFGSATRFFSNSQNQYRYSGSGAESFSASTVSAENIWVNTMVPVPYEYVCTIVHPRPFTVVNSVFFLWLHSRQTGEPRCWRGVSVTLPLVLWSHFSVTYALS